MNTKSEDMNGGQDGMEQEQEQGHEGATTPIFNIRKSDLVRVIIQALQSLHYSESAKLLEQESGIQLHSPEVERLKDHIVQGNWDMALQCIMLILDQEPNALQTEESTLGGSGDEHSRKREISFLVLRGKYLEHLLYGRIKEALHCLRNEISPLFPIGSSLFSSSATANDTLHRLSSLIMCKDPQQLINRTYSWNWWRTPAADMTTDSNNNDNMANGTKTKIPESARMPDRDTFINQCRYELLDQLQEYLPSSLIVPENHLQRLLLQQFITPETSNTIESALSHGGISLFGRTNRLVSAPGLFSVYGLRSGISSSTPSSNVDTFFSNVVMSHVLEDHLDEVWNLRFSPNGRYLATCSADKNIILYDLQKLDRDSSCVDGTQTPATRYSPYVYRGHTDTVTRIEWSPDSTKLLSCSNDHTIKLWKLPRQGIDRRRNLNGDSASSSTNGSSRNVSHSLSYSRSFNKHKDVVTSVAWLPDCKHFISCGGGKNDKSIRLWNIEQHGSSSMINQWKLNVVIYDMAITPDGCKIIVLIHQKNMHVYYADTPEALLDMFSQRDTPPSEQESTTKSGVYILRSLDYLTSITISPCGGYVLGNAHRDDDINGRQSQEGADAAKSIQEGALHLWDLNQRKMVSEFTGHAQSHYVLHPSFGSNNRDPLNWRYVLSGSEDGRVCVWERSRGEILQSFDAHSGSVNSVAWNWHYTLEGEDDKSKRTAHLFASASDDMTVRLFSANCI